MDALLLSRLQFAFTIGFHILFPTLTIGLGLFLVVLEGLWLKRRDPGIYRMLRFWTRVFALAFGVGVVSGLVLSYQLGTNWGRFTAVTGNVLGPLISYEVVTAFFLEAGFLGIMLFGWNRVPPKIHYLSTILVAVGTLISTFWILSANSWMHTPAGFAMDGERMVVTDWMAVVFNPSFPYRLAHMVVATLVATAFLVAGVGAWCVLRDRHRDFGRRSLSFALGMAAVAAPLQVLVGDLHGLNTLEHQPAKVAAMEGHWNAHDGPAPFILFALPDQAAGRNRAEIAIPYAGSLILTHSLSGAVPTLAAVAPQDRPPVAVVFWAFRLMVGLGLWFVVLAGIGLYARRRYALTQWRWYLRLLAGTAPLGFVAVLAGWVVTEAGRQPWLVYGHLRTADGVSLVPAESVAVTFGLFILAYGVLLAAFLAFFLRMVARGPGDADDPPHFQNKAKAAVVEEG
ncbi:cytochrome d ubiquinol oxidase subunit I [Azospirillum fermentarium]|uniref:cytochrome ubiquinol oxidase subunit I n=1 Tax=Azospirillum fermentarium TaxID=1233114 RepID=UPI0022262946|nr:cytochrome ubiquinol oxidase subunit I [Azospirillum fermentarium]MCW2246566.1 cytochrome d ubiquinol oxidase subunit I [Azospirillum fermentarium]